MAALHKICNIVLFCGILGFASGQSSLAQLESQNRLSLPAIAAAPATGPLRTRPIPQLEPRPSPAIAPLRISGEFREQIESWRNREFGLIEGQDDTYLLQRVYVRADYQANEYLTSTFELGSSFQFDSPFEASPIDEDPVYVQQFFADVLLLETSESKLAFQTEVKQTSADLARRPNDVGTRVTITIRLLHLLRLLLNGTGPIVFEELPQDFGQENETPQ